MTNNSRLPGAWNWAHAPQRSLAYARRLSQTEEDAQEITQEALLRAWRKRDQCRDLDTSVAWILQITRNEVLRAAERRRAHAPLDAIPEPWTDGETDAIDLRVAMRAALDSLPAGDRLLQLRYEDDLTQSAVAKHTGMPEGSVKVRLHRLRNQLRETLQEIS